MLAALWTQVLCRAQPDHSSPPLPTSIASTSGWGDGPLGSHPEPGSSWGGNQALAEAAARLAPRTVPGPLRAGWDWGWGRLLAGLCPRPTSSALWVHVQEGIQLGCLVPQGGGWTKSKPKHPAVLGNREVSLRGGEMAAQPLSQGSGEKPQTLSNLGS